MKPKFLLFISSILIITVFASCKKTIDAPELSNSKILAYNVPVSDGTISGVIDETDKTITVYLPFYYELSVIDPTIKLADGATLTGKIAPVDVLDTKTTYTVTGIDKTATTYKLFIVIQQVTPLTISEYSTATAIAKYDLNGTIGVTGNFYTADINKVSSYLVNKTTKVETKLAASGFGLNITNFGGGIYGLNSYAVTSTLDTGLYYIKVSKLGLSTQTTYPIRLKYANPVISVITAKILKQGETFTIIPAGSVFHNFTSFTVNINGQQADLPIVSYTPTSAVIKIPDTMTIGAYGLLTYTANFTGLPSYSQSFNLTVQAK